MRFLFKDAVTVGILGVVTLMLAFWGGLAWYLLHNRALFKGAGEFGDAFGVLTCLFSGLGFAGVVAAFAMQIKDRRERGVEATFSMLQLARQERFVKARNIARLARIKWFRDAEYGPRMIGKLFPQSLATLQQVYEDNQGNATDAQEMKAIYDLLEFYSVLSVYPCDDATLELFALYFPAWRGFLWTFVVAYERQYKELARTWSARERAQLPMRHWGKCLRRLEDRMGLPRYQIEHHPLDLEILRDGHRQRASS